MLLSTLQLIPSISFVRTSNNHISWFHHGPGRLCAKMHPCQSQMVRIPECHLYLHRDDSREFCNADGFLGNRVRINSKTTLDLTHPSPFHPSFISLAMPTENTC